MLGAKLALVGMATNHCITPTLIEITVYNTRAFQQLSDTSETPEGINSLNMSVG